MTDNTILIKDALILNPLDFKEIKGSLLIKNDKIAEIGTDIDESNVDKVIDAKGKILLPGFVNTHTLCQDFGFRGLADVELSSRLNDNICRWEGKSYI